MGTVSFTTPGTYFWTVPPGATQILQLILVGGGGAGGVTENGGGGGGGGGGQPNAGSNVGVTPGQVLTIVVGAGGVQTVFGGTNGGASVLNGGIVANGGQAGGNGVFNGTGNGGAGFNSSGGSGNNAGFPNGAGGGGGGFQVSGGNGASVGGAGGAGYTDSAFSGLTLGSGGGGGGTRGGGAGGPNAGNGGSGSGAGEDAPAGYGGGGGGAGESGGFSGTNGGNGGGGMVMFSWSENFATTDDAGDFAVAGNDETLLLHGTFVFVGDRTATYEVTPSDADLVYTSFITPNQFQALKAEVLYTPVPAPINFQALKAEVLYSLAPLPSPVLDIDVGIFQLDGQDATFTTFTPSPVLSVNPGTFVLTGSAATLEAAISLAVNPGTFVLTGHNAALALGAPSIALDAVPGVFHVVGASADLTFDRVLSEASGRFHLSGAATLSRATQFSISPGAFILTGHTADLADTLFSLVADPGRFTLVGAGNFLVNHKFPISVGAFALNGAARLAYDRALDDDTGVFVVTPGTAVFPVGFGLPIATGMFVVTGNLATLAAARKLNETEGTFVVIGSIAEILTTPTLSTRRGDFRFDPPGAALAFDHAVVGSNQFQLMGLELGTQVTHKLQSATGRYLEAGSPLVETFTRHLSEIRGVYTTAGAGAMTLGIQLAEVAGSFALTLETLEIFAARTLSEAPGFFELLGVDAALLDSASVIAPAGLRWLIVVASDLRWLMDCKITIKQKEPVNGLVAETSSIYIAPSFAGIGRSFNESPGTYVLTGHSI